MLRRSGLAGLLLVSLCCLSRPLRRQPVAVPDADRLLLLQRPVDEQMVNPAFGDNRGNIAWSADPRKSARVAKGKTYMQKDRDTY